MALIADTIKITGSSHLDKDTAGALTGMGKTQAYLVQ